jgi:8-hydroxy-5-deazaflavin:NADPH oxidoreductase
MRIGILGTGVVGVTLATALMDLGHEVRIGTRDPKEALSADRYEALRVAVAKRPMAVATFAEAAAASEVVVNATAGSASLAALGLAGAGNLAHKPLLDTSNPLDFSRGMPPTLLVKDTDSLGEQIQRAFPEALVVKSLNTVTSEGMVNPRAIAKGDHTMFVAGNHEGAKETVVDLLTGFGHRDVIDLGDITAARAMEMMLPMWLRLYGLLGTPMVAFKVAR